MALLRSPPGVSVTPATHWGFQWDRLGRRGWLTWWKLVYPCVHKLLPSGKSVVGCFAGIFMGILIINNLLPTSCPWPGKSIHPTPYSSEVMKAHLLSSFTFSGPVGSNCFFLGCWTTFPMSLRSWIIYFEVLGTGCKQFPILFTCFDSSEDSCFFPGLSSGLTFCNSCTGMQWPIGTGMIPAIPTSFPTPLFKGTVESIL